MYKTDNSTNYLHNIKRVYEENKVKKIENKNSDVYHLLTFFYNHHIVG